MPNDTRHGPLIRLGPGTLLLDVNSLRRQLGFTQKGMGLFLEGLNLPTVKDPTDKTGRQFVNAYSLEVALTVATLPGGPGFPHRDVIESCWSRMEDPELTETVGLLLCQAAVMYGAHERDVLIKRLQYLGDRLLQGVLRDAKVRGRRSVPTPKTVKTWTRREKHKKAPPPVITSGP